jgi:Transcription factor WhiB
VNADDLLADLACGMPRLPHAACRSHRDLFDSIVPGDITSAIAICKHACPALDPCARWADSLPPRSLTGVVAGLEDRTYNLSKKKEQ